MAQHVHIIIEMSTQRKETKTILWRFEKENTTPVLYQYNSTQIIGKNKIC